MTTASNTPTIDKLITKHKAARAKAIRAKWASEDKAAREARRPTSRFNAACPSCGARHATDNGAGFRGGVWFCSEACYV